MRIPFRKLRNLAKTTEALVVSAWLTRQGHPPSRRLVLPELPEQLTASLALPEPAAAIDEGAWRAAETIEALEGLTFGEEAIAPPASIECFDISHFCGLQTVGASSAFDRGVLAPDRYGWYTLSDGPPDDPAAIARSVTQRLEETDPPDLFVLDGGIAQLNAATRAVAAAGASTRCISLAKREELIYGAGPTPLALPRHSPTLTLLRRLRDEAHAAALLAHRRARGRAGETTFASVLDEAPLDPDAKRSLRAAFTSAADLRTASEDDLRDIIGDDAAAVQSWLAAPATTQQAENFDDLAALVVGKGGAVDAVAADGRRRASSAVVDAAAEAQARRWWQPRRALRLETTNTDHLARLLEAASEGTGLDDALLPWMRPSHTEERPVVAALTSLPANQMMKRAGPAFEPTPGTFQMRSPYEPRGDQPTAIAHLVTGLGRGTSRIALAGATGTGKTFVLAHAIEALSKPTLVLAPNKVLAAQLWSELHSLFPDNCVKFFCSHFDFYRPESYSRATDNYVEKRSATNSRIDALRHDATRSLLERRDTIVVATVSCIYGLGMPAEYVESAVPLQEGQPWASPAALADTIASLRYAPGSSDRGSYSLAEDDGAVTLSVGLVVDDLRLDVRLVSDDTWTIESLALVGEDASSTVDAYVLYPASHHAATPEEIERACDNIEIELVQELERHLAAGRWREAERLRRRVSDDVAMLRAEGWCAGAENYARHLSGRAEHEAPATLIDYFPDDDWLLVVDEAHVAVPQLRGMHAGDRARKTSLVENGFRLKSALDNRPLTASEFWARVPQAVLATATPSEDVLDMCDRSPENVASLVVRPTGVVDPSVTVVNASKAGGLEDHLLAAVSNAEGRALVTCLTKRSAEALADFLTSHGIPAAWLHADLDSQKRLKVLDALRRGDLKAVVGCNLLREGLDLPQVSLVAIVGAEKRGYLRSATSLIQTIGRAARHVNGEVLLYTDDGFVSDSMREAIEETNRRRSIQLRYNEDNGVTPRGAAAAGGDANDALAELLGPSRGGPGGGGAMRELPVFEDPTDEALHVALREWRKATAAANRKRPFRVFPERTLQDLVAKKPTTTSELKEVWGLGPARLARHGDEVLAVVREYVVSR